ncbi:MAG: FG-GAP repeat protein, partial [Planctomycetota bacterium JB042]
MTTASPSRPGPFAALLGLAALLSPWFGPTAPSARAGEPPIQSEEQVVWPADLAGGAFFGQSVAISGETMVAGRNTGSGAVDVYDRIGGVWTHAVKLVPADGAFGDSFGDAVGIDGDTVVVGATYDDDKGQDSGSLYVYERVAGAFTQGTKLTAGDGAPFERFGDAVAVTGGVIVGGTPNHTHGGVKSGAAYVWEKVGVNWTPIGEIRNTGAAASDRFGWSVDTDGARILVGATLVDGNSPNSGAAFVFEKVGGLWTQTAQLVAADGMSGDDFGYSVAIDGDVAIVGAQSNDEAGSTAGAAYVFERVAGTWVQTAKLIGSDIDQGDRYGWSVAADGGTLVVGSTQKNIGKGGAYVYRDPGGGWTQTARYFGLGAHAGSNDNFGFAVAIDGPHVLVGATFADPISSNNGAVYAFDTRVLPFGGGCGASAPRLFPHGDPIGGGTVSLTLEGGPPSASGLMLL